MSEEDGSKLYDVYPHISDSVRFCVLVCRVLTAFGKRQMQTLFIDTFLSYIFIFRIKISLFFPLVIVYVSFSCLLGAVLRWGLRVLPWAGSYWPGKSLLQCAVAVRCETCAQQEEQIQGGGGGGRSRVSSWLASYVSVHLHWFIVIHLLYTPILSDHQVQHDL